MASKEPEIETVHEKRAGEQVAHRTVRLFDAKNEAFEYEFEQAAGDGFDPDEWEFVGEGEPSERALEVASNPTGE